MEYADFNALLLKQIFVVKEERYDYDKGNLLTAYEKNGVCMEFSYDAAGNLLKDNKAEYTYDAFNRSAKVETFDGNIQINRYDAEGLRHEMEENGKLVQFIYRDREVIVEEKAEEKIRDIRTHELLASDAESARTYYHYASDEMGSITHVTEDADVLNCYEYDAWGNPIVCEETIENRFQFNGQQYDPVSRQYYLRARFYNPVIGRFTQEDSYRGDGLNLYAYCQNNPVYYVDPSGHICEKRANEIMRKLGEHHATRREQKKLASYLRNKERHGGLTETERQVLEQVDRKRAAGGGNSNRKLVNINDWDGDVNDSSVRLYGTYDELRNAGVKDGHHIVQNASVKDVPGYNKGKAPAIQVESPSTTVGTEHYNLTQEQVHATTGGTYGKEKDIGLNSAEKNLGLSKSDIEILSDYVDDYFCNDLGLNNDSPIRIPGNRHNISE